LTFRLKSKKTIDTVDVFRKAKVVQPIVEQAIKLRTLFGKPLVVWMQIGIINEQAAELRRRLVWLWLWISV
jgi:predicted CoA-binding protein